MALLGEPVRDFAGRVIGYIQEDKVTGDKIGRDFYGVKVGTWSKKLNVTRDFYGRIVARGDTLSALIWDAENQYRQKEIKK